MKETNELIDSLKIEYKELFEKRQKLQKFLDYVFDNDPPIDNTRSLLIAQLYAMDTYIQILRLRFLELNVPWSEYDEN